MIDTTLDAQIGVLDPFQGRPDDGGFIIHVAVEASGATLLLVLPGAVHALARIDAITGVIIDELELPAPGYFAYKGSPDALAYVVTQTGISGEIGVVKDTVIERVFYLHGMGSIANPVTLLLDDVAPTATTEKYKDSGSVNFNGGNAWAIAGTWSGAPALVDGQSLLDLGPLHVWVGLKNSDDQGTQFDVRAEVLRNGAVVSTALVRCVTGVTRNAALAKEVAGAFGSFGPVAFDGTNDVLALRLSTRIGTNPNDTKCQGPGGSHNNATGLRYYFDSQTRKARFGGTLAE